MLTKTRATVEDLYNAPGKAELINGELVVLLLSTGLEAGTQTRRAEGFTASLDRHEEENGGGYALPVHGC